MTMKPYDLSVSKSGGVRHLRFANQVANQHTGPLQVHSNTNDGDCNGDGDAENDAAVEQKLYRDADFDGAFMRDVDTLFTTVSAGCMVFHPDHNHWHLGDFARYVLRQDTASSNFRFVGSSTKTSFCLMDSLRVFSSLLGSPPSAYFSSCTQTADQGISVGWSDVYGSSLAGQSIPIGSERNKWYCLVSTADPLGILHEKDDANNTYRLRVYIKSGSASASSQPCAYKGTG